MAEITVYHNPVCSNSRGTLDLLERILDAIPDEPSVLVRHDKRFEELGLDPNGYNDREAVIDVLLEHPELMQRPVVFKGDKAMICRPPEKVFELFDS
jgi:arsenate reductase (glutaredoxin)